MLVDRRKEENAATSFDKRQTPPHRTQLRAYHAKSTEQVKVRIKLHGMPCDMSVPENKMFNIFFRATGDACSRLGFHPANENGGNYSTDK